MIIGNGLIARAFLDVDKKNVIFYASGVSNSLEINEKEFLREENLIRKTIAENYGKLFVYFSTCSIYDSSKNGSAYVNHKLNMEHLVSTECEQYLIARVSNAVGQGGNSHTLINFLVNSLRSHETIQTHINATRNLIDVEDVVKITMELLQENKINRIVNVAYLANYSIVQIIAIVEEFLGKKAELELLKAGQSYSIDIPDVRNYFRINDLQDKEAYLKNILRKYYHSFLS